MSRWPHLHQPARVPYVGRRVPHMVIEVNQCCNIACPGCYKRVGGHSKTLEQVVCEIDKALAIRDLSTITLAGGEPTLHEDLDHIVEYATRKGLKVNLLTNGITLDDDRLIRLRKAGTNRVLLHVDSVQVRPDVVHPTTEKDLNALREDILSRAAAVGLRCGLSVTLRRRNLPELHDIVNFALDHAQVDVCLFTLFTDFERLRERFEEHWATGSADRCSAEPVELDLPEEQVRLDDVCQLLARTLGMHPFRYLPSSLREHAHRWHLYLVPVVHSPDGRSKRLIMGRRAQNSVAGLATRLTRRRVVSLEFDTVLRETETVLLAMGYGMGSLHPVKFARSLQFLARRLNPRSRLVSHIFVFQQGPNLTADGRIEYCCCCPDATIRHDRVVPVCLSDVLCPPPDKRPPSEWEKVLDRAGIDLG